MPVLLDTDVVIHLRDGEPWIGREVRRLPAPLHISAITLVELENGVVREHDLIQARRARIDELLTFIETLDFGANEIVEYRRILEATGYSRRKVADRMTAATALVHDLTLVTLNGRDFRDVPGLKLLEWDRPEGA